MTALITSAPHALPARHRTRLLGVDFDDVSREQVLDWMEHCISERTPRMIWTPNADHLLRVRTDRELREIGERADLVTADGMGVVYAARLLKKQIRENVGGRLLLPAFAARAARKGYRLFLVGGRDEEQAAAVVAKLESEFPGLRVGTCVPPFKAVFTESDTQAILDAIWQAEPDVLFVCLGTPKQEKWIADNLHRLRVPVAVGIGAAMDVLSGRVPECPRWMTAIGVEWLYKIWREPRRMWRRYVFGIPRFSFLVLREWFRVGDGRRAEQD